MNFEASEGLADMSSIQANTFEYKTLNHGNVVIKYDHSAVTTGGGGKTDEPAWSFRLWNGSIYLSRYLETISSTFSEETVIDLGSGTGLTSIVLGKCCGAKNVYATDLSHAIPLLSHNITQNFALPNTNAIPERPTNFVPNCPANHALTPVMADCEDYMCNVCDFDIVEDSCIHRCVECNFDICVKCMSKASSGDLESFPEWFRLQLESNSSEAQQSDADQLVVPFVYDWSSADSLQALVTEVCRIGSRSGGVMAKYLIAADVTYSKRSIDLFFTAVIDVSTALRVARRDMCSTPHPPPKRRGGSDDEGGMILLFSHHNRSEDTNDHMLQQLRLKFEGRYEHVPFDELLREDREDSDVAVTGDMKIFKVLL